MRARGGVQGSETNPPLWEKMVSGQLVPPWGGQVDLRTGTAFELTVYPGVRSVFPASGGLTGGNAITLTGTSFSAIPAENAVTVGGVPCAVTAATDTTLTCTLGAHNASAALPRAGLRGVRARTYKLPHGRSTAAWDLLLPPPSASAGGGNSLGPKLMEEEVLLSTVESVRRACGASASASPCELNQPSWIREYAAQELTGVFVAPLTGTYEWYANGGDSIDVGLDLGSAGIFTSVARSSSCRFRESAYTSAYHIAGFLPNMYPACDGSSPSPPPPPSRQLQAGGRYPFRLRHVWHAYSSDKLPFAKMALRITGITAASSSPTLLSGIRAAAPANGVQKLRLGAPQRCAAGVCQDATEVHTIRFLRSGATPSVVVTISNPAFPTNPTKDLSFARGAGVATIAALIATAKVSNSLYYIKLCADRTADECVSVTSSDAANGMRTLTVEIKAPFDESRCQDAGAFKGHIALTAKSEDVTAERVAVAPRPICGSFRIGYALVAGGPVSWSDSIQFRQAWSIDKRGAVHENDGWDLFSKVQNVDYGSVQLDPFMPVGASKSYRTLELVLHFIAPTGKVRDLQVDTTGLTGDFQAVVTEVMAGDNDGAWLNGISADYFELPSDMAGGQSAVVVQTNGVTGGLIRPTTPVDHARAACSASNDEPKFAASWTLGCMTPLNSSLAECKVHCGSCPASCGNCCGGGSCCQRARAVCQRACDELFRQLPLYNFTTWTAQAAPAYTYRTDYTPVASLMVSGSPTASQTAKSGGTVTFSIASLMQRGDDGVPFAVAAASDAVVSVGVGGGACTGVQDQGAASWTAGGVAYTGRTFTCTVSDVSAAGVYPVQVLTTTGTAKVEPAANIVLTAQISSSLGPSEICQPPGNMCRGSRIGGTPLTLVGVGVKAMPCSTVLVGDLPCLEPATAPQPILCNQTDCRVCLTPSLAATALNTDVLVKSITIVGEQKGSFSYMRSKTAQVTSVTPAMRSAAVGALVTLVGTSLNPSWVTPTPGLKPAFVVKFARQMCGVIRQNNTNIDCRCPRTPPGERYGVTNPIVWSSVLGYAEVSPSATLDARFEILSISPRFLSRGGGGRVTITGAGFVAPASKFTITLMMPFGERRQCRVLTVSSTSSQVQTITCEMVGAGPMEEGAAGPTSWAQATSGPIDHNRRVLTSMADTDTPRQQIPSFAQAALQKGRMRLPGRTVEDGSAHGAWLTQALATAESELRTAEAEAEVATDAHTRRRLSESWDLPPRHGGGAGQIGTFSRSAGFLVVTVNHVEAECKAPNRCNMAYVDEATPVIDSISPDRGAQSEGTIVTIVVKRPPPDAAVAFQTVRFGSTSCPVSSVGPHGSINGSVIVTVRLCAFEAGSVNVSLFSNPRGVAVVGDKVSVKFTQQLLLTAVTPASGPFFGGSELTLTGSGFGASARPSIGGQPCEVSSVTPTTLKCFPPLQVCPDGWLHSGDKCYQLVNQRVLYPIARASCAASGGRLATIHTAEDNALVASIANGLVVWIGLEDTGIYGNQRGGNRLQDPGDAFKWSDGSNMTYSNWDLVSTNSF
eukprot:COSAG01_NODE_222_length_21420_cov_30.616763_12_plen_1546_part_00